MGTWSERRARDKSDEKDMKQDEKIDLTHFDRVYVYGARDPILYSGSPYYFMHSIREVVSADSKYFIESIPLKRIREMPLSYLLWSLRNGTFESSAFLFSSQYHKDSISNTYYKISDTTAIISFTKDLAPQILDSIDKSKNNYLYLYWDATYIQLLDTFKYARTIVGLKKQELLARERRLLERARRIFVYDEVVQSVLLQYYHLNPANIHITGRGLNMTSDEFAVAADFRSAKLTAIACSDMSGVITLTLIGRDARRKGVFQVIDAIDALSEGERRRIRFRIVGPNRSIVPRRDYIEAIGFLGPQRRTELLKIIASTDVGVLMSSAEGLPGSLREFTCLGVPCWVAWLPQFERSFNENLIFKEATPLSIDSMTHTLRKILEHSPKSLYEKGAAGFGYIGWTSQAKIVANFLASDSR
jgi:glycosyltransferase involved in cell wall biosynthesis